MSDNREALKYRSDILQIVKDSGGGSAVDIAWAFSKSGVKQVFCSTRMERFLRENPSVLWDELQEKYVVKK